MYKKQPIPEKLRKQVFERDKYRCRYCGSKNISLHADHVYPESKGGATILENLVAACPDCNYRKNAIVGIWPYPNAYWDEKEQIDMLFDGTADESYAAYEQTIAKLQEKYEQLRQDDLEKMRNNYDKLLNDFNAKNEKMYKNYYESYYKNEYNNNLSDVIFETKENAINDFRNKKFVFATKLTYFQHFFVIIMCIFYSIPAIRYWGGHIPISNEIAIVIALTSGIIGIVFAAAFNSICYILRK
jgi:hypothetical protein